ncbi:HutD family protein [Neorhizobium lilium]|uniref:HutD family protein n=1 Tax=Neorhizobium lilium TaxID=2503024 RepID=A0A444LBW1_9HYPH|nr:HutD family protein [Neorhizobium lilium]RWX74996.1 HutD family protein [Neorhizobium lilium]
MKILRSAKYKRMPWKNGKGETVEIAVFPPGASVETFDWRISMAMVAEDGPFSVFDGIDRTLSILTGDGMELTVEGHAPVLLKQASQPYAFPGDARTTATLTGGPISDLNVMTRRGRFTHRVRRVVSSGEMSVTPEADLTMVVVAKEARLGDLALSPLDALVLDKGEAPAVLHFETETTVFLIDITPAASA